MPDHPDPTHGGAWERRTTGSTDRPHVTSGEALDGLVTDPEPEEILRGKYWHLLAEIPPGDNYLYYTAERGHPSPQFKWRQPPFWSFLLRSSTPTAIPHDPGSAWLQRRALPLGKPPLRLSEVKRLFTFPDGFEFAGSRGSAQYTLGNSVPPLLAQRVAEAVRMPDPRRRSANLAGT